MVAVPIGSVTIGPEIVGGERSFVRRVTMKAGVTVVELSATPFLNEGRFHPAAVCLPRQPVVLPGRLVAVSASGLPGYLRPVRLYEPVRDGV